MNQLKEKKKVSSLSTATQQESPDKAITTMLKESIAYESQKTAGITPEVEDRYYSLKEVLGASNKVPVLQMLARKYGLTYEKDYNDMWPGSEYFIWKMSNNEWTLAYHDAASELGAVFRKMPLGPDYFEYKGQRVYIYSEPDRVIFSNQHVHVIETWNITKEEVLESIKEVLR